MGIFSKETCVFCNKQVGMLSRKKMQDKQYICKDCEKDCSAYIEVSRLDEKAVKEHMEYMKKEDVLYKKEFATLDKKQIDHFGYQFEELNFADDIAMFEYVTPKYKKKNHKELIRYYQISTYDTYKEAKPSSDGKEHYEVGVIINIRCSDGINGAGMSESEKKIAHPYISQIKFSCGENDILARNIKDKFNQIFLREAENKGIGTKIKESFIGTETERRQQKLAVDGLKSIASAIKAQKSGDVNSKEQAKEQLKQSAFDVMNEAFSNMGKYQEIAEQAEKRAWGE